jgi:hypothetical protein
MYELCFCRFILPWLRERCLPFLVSPEDRVHTIYRAVLLTELEGAGTYTYLFTCACFYSFTILLQHAFLQISGCSSFCVPCCLHLKPVVCLPSLDSELEHCLEPAVVPSVFICLCSVFSFYASAVGAILGCLFLWCSWLFCLCAHCTVLPYPMNSCQSSLLLLPSVPVATGRTFGI